MREKLIRLHPKYGLNPTVSQCIICGKDKNEIALLGNAYKGEAPMHMVTSLEPCDKCKEEYLKIGVLLVEFTGEKGQPTGSLMVLKDEAYTRIFNKPIPPKKIAAVEIGVLQRLQPV